MTEEIVHLEPLEAIRQEAIALADPGEIERYALALEHISEIKTRHDAETVRAILTRANSIATAQSEYCKKYSSAYFKIHRQISAIEKSITFTAISLRAKCETLLGEYLDRQERERIATQSNLEELTTAMREEGIAKAQDAAMRGDMETARQLQSEADMLVVPILQAQKPNLDGVSVAEGEMVVIEDVMEFIKGIASGKINLAVTLVGPDRKKANLDAPVAVAVLQSALDANYNVNWPGCAKVRKRNFRVTTKDL